MRARRVELREQRDVGAGFVRLDRGAHSGKAGADDQYIVLCDHCALTLAKRAREGSGWTSA
jgi:hypothetical protein